MTILRSSGAKDMRPRFRPEKRPLSATSTAAMMYCQTSMAAARVGGVQVDCWRAWGCAPRATRGCLFNWLKLFRSSCSDIVLHGLPKVVVTSYLRFRNEIKLSEWLIRQVNNLAA